MGKDNKLQIGDVSDNGQVTIIDEDRLCYVVKSVSKGAVGLRTISKKLLAEFVEYIAQHPNVPGNEVRYKISGQSDIDKYEYGYAATIVVMAKMVLGQEGFSRTANVERTEPLLHTLQQIFYGAPGTGKSHKVNDLTSEAEMEERVFRTTFHPDSDYSTFVGAYKPSMTSSEKLYSMEELIVKLNEIKNSGTTYPCHKFASKYWESLKDLTANDIKKILAACGFTEAYGVEVSKGIAIGQEYLNKRDEGKIVYSFTPQAFTNAYVKAWNTTDDVFLIIEEINRGNCAQIFGDLFQLLDRKNGISEYPVDADSDLKDYINTELQNSPRTDFPKGVKEGKKLVLPSNLYIWATMNTSDQSLFPIDSAFKRRWEWKYIPIKNHEDKNYKIEIGLSNYDWWEFLRKINQVINVTTNSEDKKLGYFFVKTEDGKITAEQFVGKVLFYLWNDVFKNYGFDNSIFDKDDKKKFEFSDFFDDNGDPNTDMINRFLVKLDETIDKEHSFIEAAISDTNNQQNSENTENSGDTENTDM